MGKDTSRGDTLKQLVLGLGLFLLALGPRAFGLSVFVTIDEWSWIKRSVQFFSALSVGDWANTFQTGHPGVTTKWTGTVGLVAKYLLQPQQPSLAGLWAFLEPVPLLPSVSVEYLPVMRFPTVLLTSACVVAVYFMVRQIFGERVALLSGVLLALDPFYLSHSRVIHHDALAATFVTMAVLSFLICVWHGRWRTFLVLSGLAAGLSFLSKGSALFLVPFVSLLCGIGFLTQVETGPELCRRDWRKIEKEALVRWVSTWLGWAAVALLIFFLLWPVMWVEPVSAVQGLLDTAIGYAGEAHADGNFFLGREVANPGPLFYPVTLSFRTTPLTLLGLAVAFYLWIRSYQQQFYATASHEGSRLKRFIGPLLGKGGERETRAQRLSLLSLWAYLFSFMLFMTLGDKKFDRYILPIYPTVEILAALGLYQLGVVVVQRFGLYRKLFKDKSLWVCGLAVATMVQAGFTLPHYPYYLTYYNPLTGGGKQAAKTILVGWGEGLDEAARYLNGKESAEEMGVVSWYYRCLAARFVGNVWPLSKRRLYWHNVDYAVLYINAVQRLRFNQGMVDYFRSLEPEYTVHFGGIDYVWIYRVPRLLPDVLLPQEYIQQVKLGDQILFLGYDLDDDNDERLQSEGKMAITLYWEALRTMEEDYTVYLKLVNSVYHIYGQQEGRPFYDGMPTNTWQVGQKVEDRRELEVLAGTPPGLYHIEVILYDPYRHRVLDTENGGLLLGPIEIPPRTPPAPGLLDIEHPLQAVLGDKVRLLGYNMESGLRPGHGIHLTLFWQALEEMDKDYTVFTHLTDAEGRIWGQKDNPPVDGFYPTTGWEAGEIVRDQYDILISPDAPPGEYQIEVGMYLAETGERLPVVDPETGQMVDRILISEIQINPQ